MIRGLHAMFYSSQPEALRDFIRDKLGFSATDVGNGWLIFDIPKAELGIHPVEKSGQSGPPSGTPYLSFYCDDIRLTVCTLRERGVAFTDEISDAGYGQVIHFRMPGDFGADLYQPAYHK